MFGIRTARTYVRPASYPLGSVTQIAQNNTNGDYQEAADPTKEYNS